MLTAQGLHWHYWPVLACIVLHWPLLACIGCHGPLVGLCWPALAVVAVVVAVHSLAVDIY